jgi:hypothetical protein
VFARSGDSWGRATYRAAASAYGPARQSNSYSVVTELGATSRTIVSVRRIRSVVGLPLAGKPSVAYLACAMCDRNGGAGDTERAAEPPARVELARVPYERTRHPMVGGSWSCSDYAPSTRSAHAGRNASHSAGAERRSISARRVGSHLGRTGARSGNMPASSVSSPPFLELQAWQAATIFVHSVLPP